MMNKIVKNTLFLKGFWCLEKLKIAFTNIINIKIVTATSMMVRRFMEISSFFEKCVKVFILQILT